MNTRKFRLRLAKSFSHQDNVHRQIGRTLSRQDHVHRQIGRTIFKSSCRSVPIVFGTWNNILGYCREYSFSKKASIMREYMEQAKPEPTLLQRIRKIVGRKSTGSLHRQGWAAMCFGIQKYLIFLYLIDMPARKCYELYCTCQQSILG